MREKHVIVNVKSDIFHTDYYQIEGNMIEKSESCMLIEKNNIYQKSTVGGYTLSSQYEMKEQRKPYVVILFNNSGNEAIFFKYLEDAHKFYTSEKI
jgi:hypothetical protein